MTQPSLAIYNEYANQYYDVMQPDQPDLQAVKRLYDETKVHPEYVLMTVRCADRLADAARKAGRYDEGLCLANEALARFEQTDRYFGTPEQAEKVLNDVIMVKLLLLACYKTKEFDEAILVITENTLQKFPGIWNEGLTKHGVFFSTQRAHALNRQGRHAEAVALYLTLQEVGARMKEPLLESIGALGWSFSVLMGGKVLAAAGKQEEAHNAWLSAATVIDEWYANITPEDEIENDYLTAQLWNSAYAKWLASDHLDMSRMVAIYTARPQEERTGLMSDILLHQLPFEAPLLERLHAAPPHQLDLPLQDSGLSL